MDRNCVKLSWKTVWSWSFVWEMLWASWHSHVLYQMGSSLTRIKLQKSLLKDVFIE